MRITEHNSNQTVVTFQIVENCFVWYQSSEKIYFVYYISVGDQESSGKICSVINMTKTVES